MLKSEVLNHRFQTALPEGKTVLTITGDEAITAFRKAVKTRNMMGGAMYRGMYNEECHMLYDVCRHHGVDEATMSELFTHLEA